MTIYRPSEQKNFTYLPQIGLYLLSAVLGAVLVLGAMRVFPTQLIPQHLNQQPQTQTLASPTPITSVQQPQTEHHNFVVAAVQRVGSAVVRIDTERTVAIPRPRYFDDPLFRHFFGGQLMPEIPSEYRLYGEGSGLIIDSKGMILTNAHVVSGAETVKVTLKDGRIFEGKVRGIDDPLELAVVQIPGKNLPIAPLGNSGEVQVGDWAIAVGNPLGLDNTVTLGIVSTVKRSSSQVGIPDKLLDFIQTDAAINPGNSGGPLLNDRGEVIGINTAIRAGASGIGFAIPIDTVKAVKDQLARGEKISHPYIGLQVASLTPELAKEINSNPNKPFTIPPINGALTIQVLPNSPATSAGLRPGDVVVEVNSEPITTAEELQAKDRKSVV